MKFSKV